MGQSEVGRPMPSREPIYRPPAAEQPAAPAASKGMTPGKWLTALGGAGLVVGAMLPWVTIEALSISRSVNGLDDGRDGWFTLAVGAVALMALLGRRSLRALVALLAGGVGVAVAVIDISDTQDKIGKLEESGRQYAAQGHIGIGLWLTAAGAAVLLLGALVSFGEKD